MFPKKKCIGNEWVKFDPLFSQNHQDDTVRTIAHLTKHQDDTVRTITHLTKTPRWHCENHRTSHKNTEMTLRTIVHLSKTPRWHWEESHISQKHQDETVRTIAHLTKTPRWNCENHRTFQKEAFLNNYSLVGIMLFIIPLKNFSNKN